MPIIHNDCRHYFTDRPCKPHKQRGRRCGDCSEYDKILQEILIVKLDAIGDVLRATSLLRPLREKYPQARVTWLTRPNATDLLKHNSLVDEILPFNHEALLVLQTKRFDVVINPDASETSCRLASLANGKERVGYWIDEAGEFFCGNEAAEHWRYMGLDDDLKKANQRSYQDLLLDICDLPHVPNPIIWTLSEDEKRLASEFAQQHNLVPGKTPILGLNTGAGSRWVWKKWTLEGFRALVKGTLSEQPDTRILLYGGPEEVERNTILKADFPDAVVDTGCDNSLRQFGALLSLCDVLVTGDTMGLHLACALEKRIVALFGPTSLPEIEIYGRGAKIAPEMDCLGCYLSDCDVRPACMERIPVDTVLESVLREFTELA
ncbi:glycosyltransferase family 9 protein [Cerasicoccus maritimus]|uniref:glycosyltransferase family 9 protein n=1 Tax=Cerasicoccus maritimus TaxID=490089 RepID=UPI00285280F0|nr:glycosyltransferase family 9 protein [Cerasicoccus maritimus]